MVGRAKERHVNCQRAGQCSRRLRSVAVDCSDASRWAVELAWRVADTGAAALDAVHAYDLFSAQAIRRAGIEGEELQRYRLDMQRNA